MFLDTNKKIDCYGCEACAQICGRQAITMQEDEEGFRYPVISPALCISCGRCRKVCPCENMPLKHETDKYAFGGYHQNADTRFESTSGGAFSAIAEAYCDRDYAIFGAETKGLQVFHSFVTDVADMGKFRKSKYSQSVIGDSYRQAKKLLRENRRVLFSGTPCQIAGLVNYLGNTDLTNLLTVEVVCEGVPSPLYIRKLDRHIENKYGAPVKDIDYRYTGKSILKNGKWDFEDMRITLDDSKRSNRVLVKDRWFNPFWSVWLNHLMSRPSCYSCPFTTTGRTADITLGDLWGVHLYCPELYGKNGGASLVVCNTGKGKKVFSQAEKRMLGHQLKFDDALKYQSPMRKTIDENPDRPAFMKDLKSGMTYSALNRKWTKKPTVQLLCQKYLTGNRQKIWFWNLKQKLTAKEGKENA